MTTAKTTERTKDAGMASGIQKHLGQAGTMTIDGTQYTIPQVEQKLADRVTLLDTAATAKAEHENSVKAVKADRPQFLRFFGALRSIIQGMYANDAKTLADFDMTPRKSNIKPTVEKKVKAVSQMLATRKARNTLGPRQKADVKGVVAPEAPPPAPQPPTPPATPSPAPQAAAAQAPAIPPAPAPATNGSVAHTGATGSGS